MKSKDTREHFLDLPKYVSIDVYSLLTNVPLREITDYLYNFISSSDISLPDAL